MPHPDVQSHGKAVLTLNEPLSGTFTVDLACEWPDASRVRWVYASGGGELYGEMVLLDLTIDPPSVVLARDGRFPYAGWTSGASFEADHSGDWANGQILFAGLEPDPAGIGPAPTPLEAWMAPLGGDSAANQLSGTVRWACEPAPPTVPAPGPSLSPEPGVTPLFRVPSAFASSPGRGSRPATIGCGVSLGDSHGNWASDSCGAAWQVPGLGATLSVPAGAIVRLRLASGWTMTEWSVDVASWSEVERFRGLVPDSVARLVRPSRGAATEIHLDGLRAGEFGSILRVAAADSNGFQIAGGLYLFRVLVEP